MSNAVRYGTCAQLEEHATALLLASIEGATRAEKSDIITPWKENNLKRREIFTTFGVPDPAVRKGQFSKSYNPAKPDLNSREGATPPPRRGGYLDDDGDWSGWDGDLSPQMQAVVGVERADY